MIIFASLQMPSAIAEAESRAGSAAPRLSPDSARTIAVDELRRRGNDVARFKAGAPEFRPEKRVWWIFFTQVAPPLSVDGDLLVVVDDATSAACLQQAIAAGPCT